MATPAEPILASNIWLSLQGKDSSISSDAPKRSTLNTNIKALDSTLEGGFTYGSTHCIVSEPDQSSKELTQALITSHLRSSPHATAVVIDSTLSFDVRKLFQLLETAYKNADEALKALERLKIMKVFDYVGLTEALAEVRGDLEAPPPRVGGRETPPPLRSTIEDSESEEEMLLDVSPPPVQLPEPRAAAMEHHQTDGLLIIDNISQVLMPLVRNNYTHGQAALSSFMRSLGHTTRTHKLCTILLSHASNKPANEDEAFSLFSSCTLRPALGPSFGSLVDVLMYLHSLPMEGQTASVLEIVQDRYGSRFGRWAPFLCEPEGTLKDIS